jgi:DNA gyrase/topoisomerase IV subunit A
LLVASATEELFFVFTSGRIAALPVESIPFAQPGSEGELWDWETAPLPSEPNAGERLACLAAIGRMAIAECFVQVSRKGCVKKIRAAMGQTILANHYIGSGVRQPSDQSFRLLLCANDNLLALVTEEGFVQCVEVKNLPPAVEEALRLETTDHLVAAFVPTPGQDILAITQHGKAIHWAADRLEVARSSHTRGQALYSASRRQQGVRVVAAGSVSPSDWGVALHRNGQITLHAVQELLRSGALPVQDELLAFTFFNAA